eukprot:11520944-Alexandrium_andersonii.AAC.1
MTYVCRSRSCNNRPVCPGNRCETESHGAQGSIWPEAEVAKAGGASSAIEAVARARRAGPRKGSAGKNASP